MGAAAESLRATVTSVAARARTGAPSFVDVTLEWKGVGVLEGVLEMRPGGRESLTIFRSHELALTSGSQSFRFVLPAPGEIYEAERTMTLRWLPPGAGREPIELGTQVVQYNNQPGRVVSIAVGRPAVGARRNDFQLWSELRAERLYASKDDMATNPPQTVPVFLRSDDFPTSPTMYCGFDLVLLEGGAMTELKEKQFEALVQWVAAGGSLCVFADQPSGDRIRDLLEEFALHDRRGPGWKMLPTGELEIAGDGGVGLIRAGLGRVVVCSKTPDSPEQMALPHWRRAVAFLWKLRGRYVDEFAESGIVRPAKIDSVWNHAQVEANYALSKEMYKALMPDEVKMVPFAKIAGLIALFALVIGPADWLLLGWLKRRKLTWISFPCASIGFALLMVYVAESHLGSNSHARTLTITDIGPGGKVVRETEVRLLFPGRDQEEQWEISHALLSLLSSPSSYRDDFRGSGSLMYAGQYPLRYAAQMQLRKWETVTYRKTSIGIRDDPSGIEWDAIDSSLLESGLSNVRPLGGREVCLDWFEPHRIRSGSLEKPGATFRLNVTMLNSELSTRLFSHTSPSGGGSFDDLTLIDTDDDGRRVIVATMRTPNGIQMYRRVYLR